MAKKPRAADTDDPVPGVTWSATLPCGHPVLAATRQAASAAMADHRALCPWARERAADLAPPGNETPLVARQAGHRPPNDPSLAWGILAGLAGGGISAPAGKIPTPIGRDGCILSSSPPALA